MKNKVVEVNLELGNPVFSIAVSKMIDAITTYKRQGYKVVILIHGYGSTGVGGGIKAAVRQWLAKNSMRGIVRAFVGGEQWIVRKREMLNICQALGDYERRISGNEGVTVVVL